MHVCIVVSDVYVCLASIVLYQVITMIYRCCCCWWWW